MASSDTPIADALRRVSAPRAAKGPGETVLSLLAATPEDCRQFLDAARQRLGDAATGP